MVYLPGNYYDIYLYNWIGNLIIPLQGWSRLEYHQRISAPWNHIIEFNTSYAQYMVDFLRENIKSDHFILIYRKDPITLNRELVYEGIHNTLVDQSDQQGNLKLTLYGSGYTTFLSRRITIPPAGFENDTKSGAAETVMKAYVNDHMVNPTDTERIFPGLTIATDQGRGEPVEQNPRYTNLMTVMNTLSSEGKMHFGITGGANIGEFIFDARPVWGLDRRIDTTGSYVPTGDPVLFNFASGNMDIPILSKNYSDDKNVAYVGGEGSGTVRTILKVTAIDTPTSQFSRKESFVDARREDADGLLVAGVNYLVENSPDLNLTFNVKQVDGSRWLENWSLGDMVSGKYYSFLQDFLIREIWVTVTAGEGAVLQENINVELEGFNVLEREFLAEYTSVYYDPSPDVDPVILVKGPYMLDDTNRIIAYNKNDKIYVFDNVHSASPSVTEIASSFNGTPVQWVPNAFCSRYTGLGTDVVGWLVTSTDIYMVTVTASNTYSATSQHTFRAETEYRSADFEFGREGYGFVASTYDDGVWSTYTTDGLTWDAENQVSSSNPSSGNVFSGSYDWYYDYDFSQGQLGWIGEYANYNVSGGYWQGEFLGLSVQNRIVGPSANVTSTINAVAVDIEITGDLDHWITWPHFAVSQAVGYTTIVNNNQLGITDITPFRAIRTVEGLSATIGSSYELLFNSEWWAWQGDVRIRRIWVAGTGTPPWTGGPTYTPITGNIGSPSAYVSTKSPDRVLSSAYYGEFGLGVYSNDNGETVTQGTNPPVDMQDISSGYRIANDLHVPYGAINELTCYHGRVESDGSYKVIRVETDGTTKTDVSPSSGGETYGPWKSRGQLATYVGNPDLVWVIGTNDDDATKVGCWKSTDGGDTWTELITPTTGSNRYTRLAVSGEDPDLVWFWGESGSFGVSYDGGVTIESISSAVGLSGADEFVGIAGG